MAKKPPSISAPKKGAPPAQRGGGGGNRTSQGGGANGGSERDASLVEEAQRRYLNYALSVITSRALPDVRDGLKPVQRRILYAMLHDEHLRPEAKHRKSAKVVGVVLGKYHPHGDSSVYDAMVRMAQDFSLRLPLVDGSGNFGSLDGDTAAAYRYTECRLAPPAMDLLRELDSDTVDMRANYDGTTEEPAVLPARYCNLLVNGCTGIAVGMATNIPPHNLKEVTNAAIALADDPNINTVSLLKHIQGPDFPTGGQLLSTKVELRQIYESGQGAIRLRGEYKLETKPKGGTDIIITSIPYGLTKSTVVEKIAEIIIARKLPYLLDVRDESTTDVRIVMEIKKDADPALVMAYLYKNTPLQVNFNMNMTCLVPPHYLESKSSKKNRDVVAGSVCQPMRVGIKEVLRYFLDFRYEVTCRRFEYDLGQLRRRIHILQGFVKIFDALDETIKIIRASEGKEDAAKKIMKRFGLDDIQTDAILELKLYRLAKLEINIIRAELEEKSKEAARIESILKSEKKLWGVIKEELAAVAEALGNPRRTKTGGVADEPELAADAFIVDEDAHVVVTRDGWIKRVREIKDPGQTRVREGDEVLAVLPGSTKEKVVFFTSKGSAYVLRINDIAATTGYGDPAQKYFKFDDGERVVSAMTLDPRTILPQTMIGVSKRGFGMRFSLAAHSEISTRAGRRYAKPQPGDEIIGVSPCGDRDVLVTATKHAHVLICKAAEVNLLEGAGRGVTVIKISDDDHVIGFVCSGSKESLVVESTKSTKPIAIVADPKQTSGRGGKGHQIAKKAELKMVSLPITIPALANADGGKGMN